MRFFRPVTMPTVAGFSLEKGEQGLEPASS